MVLRRFFGRGLARSLSSHILLGQLHGIDLDPGNRKKQLEALAHNLGDILQLGTGHEGLRDRDHPVEELRQDAPGVAV